MNLQINKSYNGFKLQREEFIEELGGLARVFEHEKSGAILIHLLNEESNKVFTVTFKTPPLDNSGAAHIVEHTVCCSSEKYPLKDTFIELEKGSLCTALNACTYQDMTMYYCASQNEKDLLNLIEVYMDLIFHPRMLKDSNFFRQEGWHYRLRSKKGNPEYSGVVYNEMTSEYDDPSAVLEHTVYEALFPDTIYRYDSGGIPEEIVQLSYKHFLDFYHKYYHPSNATICLYGNGDLMKVLEKLDTLYLKDFNKKLILADIPLQKKFDKPKRVHQKYASSNGEKKAVLALSFVIGTFADRELKLAFEILDQMLLRSSASPLLETLVVHNGLGKRIGEGGYDACRQQPVFSIVLKDTSLDKEDEFEKRIFETLKELADCGIDKRLLQASINTVEFGLREAEYSYEPAGVNYSEMIQNSALYGGDPFSFLTFEKELERIKDKADKGYFESLIKQYFLENTHRVLVVLEPSKDLEKKKRQDLNNKLKDYKKKLTEEQVEELIAINLSLDKMHSASNRSEDLEKLPMLALTDINPKTEEIILKEKYIQGIKFLFNPEAAKEIIYSHLLFDTTSVSEEDIPYIGLLAQLITYVGTASYSYLELDHAINTHIGGLSCAANAYANQNEQEVYKPFLKISSKFLVKEMKAYIALMKEILNTTKFTERAKIKEILGSIQYEMETSFINAPEYVVTKRIYAYISHAGVYEDLVSGITYYHFIKNLYNHFDENYEEMCSKLEKICMQILNRNNLTISITAQEKYRELFEEKIQSLIISLQQKRFEKNKYDTHPIAKNEGFLTSNSLQTIGKGLNYKYLGYSFHGVLQVIANILESTYLWDKVRLMGGAYGCNMTLGLDGNMVICSYADPHLVKTLEVYNTIGNFLRQLDLSEKELHKYILGTVGTLDSPLSIEQKSERALTMYFCGITHDILQKARNELLSASKDDILHYAALFDELAKDDILCVIGETTKLKQHQKIFRSLSRLHFE